MSSTRQQNQSKGAGFFLILTLFFLGISVYQTAIGYELMLPGHISWFLSFAFGLLMLFLAFEMRRRRARGISAWGPLIGYCAVAIYCFFGNFNSIYSSYNRNELFKRELSKHKQELTAIVTSATAALENCDTLTVKLQKSVNEHKGQLVLQLTDPARPGKDFRAEAEITILEGLLGQKLTDLGGTPQQMADGYSRNIDNILTTRLANSKQSKAKALIDKIKAKQDTLDIIILEAIKPANVSAKGQDAIFKTVDAINSIGEQTKNFLGSSAFEFKQAEFENQELGKISHSFASAFNGENWAAAILSMVVAFGIDALVPFVIFVGTRRDDEDDEETHNGRRGGSGVVVIR
jgi:hypothetical protein